MDTQAKTPKATILIVDDSEAVRRLINTYLVKGGYNVLEAGNGLVGLEVVKEKTPDLILLDITMPIIDGYSVCARLQQNEKTSAIPILMLSALNDTESKIRSFELGAVDYITKPVTKGELLARIETHLTISRLTASLQQANDKLLAHQKQLLEGLHAAANLQKNLLPKRIPNCKSLRFSSYFKPCEEIGGDIYNIQRVDKNHIAIHLIDVSGHGFPAAMMTALASQALSTSGTIITSLHNSTRNATSPVDVVNELDKEFPLERFNLYMTLFYLLINTKTNHFRYCCAGHPAAIHMQADNSLTLLDVGGPPAGMGGKWEEGEGVLKSGDRIFFYTDGLTEYSDQDGNYYTQERLLQSMRMTTELSLQATVQDIIGTVKQFGKQAPADDDMTLLAMERVEEVH